MRKLRSAAALFLLASSAAAQVAPTWFGAWSAPPIAYEPRIRDALGRPFKDETVRQIVGVASSGGRLRLRLSNELSDTVLRIGAASVARLDAGGAVVPGSVRALAFAGSKSATIPANAPFYTDPLDLPVRAGERLAVSIYYPGEAAPPAHAQMVDVVTGDQTARAQLASPLRARAPGLVSAVEVSGSPRRVLVAFGDSITEGAGASPGEQMSYPDQLARLLAARPSSHCWSVVNAGISGNRLLHDGRGPNALARFDRDALAVPGVTHVLLLEGINDIGKISDPAKRDQAVTADQIIAAYRQLLARAHARQVKLIVGTLLPYEGAAYADAEGEVKRATVNRWIRANRSQFAGLVDFDIAMQEPGKPKVMRLDSQIGDHLHPNDQGYARMAHTAAGVVGKISCARR
ncbi:SGNH/GDSL hydrolase family protein [Sphingomonas sp. DG1-23]|uniref:SGNH/GDSL hydrolase family protein n=1 Tax=Sphingomonas sp. DG1-23 TaxID=3068316 RepID=UPI00273DBF36|nr:SGNH/GDSL hydrolase family protein [Sphingomonas sp. DG1-23]MDP5279789.1 SGNH/GDSL hydrolase family protein [Sphingomonas sp. DG1-23]